ncbi:MAG: protein disulfide oxidoreductase [Candidatus Anstonellales archaeon]
MAILDEETKNQLKQMFSGLSGKVKLIFFKPSAGCQFCAQVEELVNEVVSTSSILTSQIHVLEEEKELAKRYKLDKAPAIIIEGKNKGLVRYFGIPSGYEFSSFIQDIIDASTGEVELPDDIKQKIKSINFPLHIQVFVTPTCPYCPPMVKLAHDLALLNENVVADMVEATEFRELAMKYNVQGVPKTIVNEKQEFDGAYPADIFIKRILELKGKD